MCNIPAILHVGTKTGHIVIWMASSIANLKLIKLHTNRGHALGQGCSAIHAT